MTLDGSQLTKHLSFVMAGVKLVDIGCKNPHTGIYELMPCQDANGKTFYYMPQTRRNCFPLKLCMGKESKQMYQDEFGEAFDLFNQASIEGQTLFQEWKPLNTSMPADMAAIQKALGVGGAAKVFNFFAIVAHSPCVILQIPMMETNTV